IHQISLKYPVKTRWGSLATCLNSLVQNQLALKLTITELSHDSHTTVPDAINKLVADISTFESDTPRLALFYQWYHEQLESDDNKIIYKLYLQLLFIYVIIYYIILDYVFLAVVHAIKNLLENRWKKIYQLVLSVAHLLDPRYHRKNFLLMLTFPKLESSDLMEATIHSNNRPCENHKFELLDPDDNDESSKDELIVSNDENEDIELSESEMELLSESDVDSEDE
ncbi:22330_t:CDS:2, partial [Gigaspora rosea]